MERRSKFFLALALYAAWVLSLGVMAWLSADRPQPRPHLTSPR